MAGSGGSGGRPPLWRRARRRAWWLAALLVAAVATRMPAGRGRAAGVAIARMGLRLRGKERRLAQRNLALAFPERDAGERRRLLGEAAVAAGRNLYDALAAPRLLADPLFVRDEPGPDGRPLLAVVRDEVAAGRGLLVMSGHLGCWELFGAWLAGELAKADLPRLHVATGVVRNPAVDGWLARRRRASGLVPVPRTAGVGPLLRCLRGGGVVAALVDQNTDVDSRPVPFFGIPAPTPAGPARLAVRLRTPVVVATIARRPDGGHVVTHGEVWRPRPDVPAEQQVDLCLMMANARLEACVRRNPAEWVWYHRRWDSSPAPDGSGMR
ncbi:MAG: lysophospholipid acyltransferase family protein [bacterium]|nr:lysophospholipid acyltransferase family protein [bacterium]